MSGRSVLSIDRRRAVVSACLIGCSFALAFVLELLSPGLLDTVNSRAADGLFKVRYGLQGRGEVSPYLVHVVVTDSTRQALGLSGWDRRAFGQALEILQGMGARTIACDVFFKDASFHDNDEALVRATAKSGRIVFPLLAFPEGHLNPEAVQAASARSTEIPDRTVIHPNILVEGSPPLAAHLMLPFAELAEVSGGLGHINCEPDGDGRNRRLPLLYRYGEGYVAALSLRAVLEFFEVDSGNIEISFGRQIVLRGARAHDGLQRDIAIPIDGQGRLIINAVGPWQDSFLTIPLQGLFSAQGDDQMRARLRDLMEGALVVISDVSTASRDYGPGIFESVYPLSGLHVSVVNSILTGNFLSRQGMVESLLTALGLALVLWLASTALKSFAFPVFLAGLYAAYLASCYGLFAGLHRVPPVASMTAGFLLTLISVTAYRVVVAGRERSVFLAKLEANRALEGLNAQLVDQKRELQNANERLKEMGHFKANFVQNVAHELRTPLALILDPLEALQRTTREELPPSVVQDLGQIDRNARKLLQLVDQFLDVSRIEAGKARLSVREGDITGFLRRQLALFGTAAARRGVQLRFSSDTQSVSSYFDEDKLEKIVSNLLANAVKSTGANGAVELSAAFPETVEQMSRSTPAAALKPDQMLVITVSDTGDGIPPEDLPYIFERFHKRSRPAAGHFGGTGIGLSLVKECVDIHHGRITVTSEKHRGTKVIISLPWAREHFRPEEISPVDQREEEPPLVAAPEHPTLAVTTGRGDPDEPILLVDDEPDVLDNYVRILRENGIGNLLTCSDGTRVLPMLRERQVCAVVLDLALPGVSGTMLLSKMKEELPSLQVLVVTGLKDVDVAVECIKLGASEYLVKPLERSRLVATVRRCMEKRRLEKEVDVLSRRLQSLELRNPEAFSEIVTCSRLMLAKLRYVEAIAGDMNPVLITGESGVGKELVARAVHRLSGRQGSIVCENVAGLDDTMFADTLFGHRKGAFTGAEGVRKGLVEEAAGGTLFLDEIGDMSVNSQVKLLRFIEEKEYRPLGSDSVKVSDARVVIATNVDLATRLEEGRFREDLFFRLTHRVEIPPLRDRPEDLPLLIENFAKQAAEAHGKEKPPVPRELTALLGAYSFPGNIRELKNMVAEALSRSEPGTLSLSYFREYIRESSGRLGGVNGRARAAGAALSGEIPTLRESESVLISEALRKTGGNQNLAARLLGLSPSALSRRLKKEPKE